MLNQNEFQFQIDGILKEARNSSVITISCMKTKAGKAKGKEEEISVLSMNGYTDPNEFKKFLQHLVLKIEEDTMQKQTGLAQVLRSQLLEEVIQSVTEILDRTVRQIPGNCGSSGDLNSDEAWEFISPDIRIGSKRGTEPGVINKVNEGAKEYASAFRHIFARLVSKLGILSMVVQYVRTEVQGIPAQTDGKIVIDSTVAKFATLNRIFYEYGIFGECNKTELCQLLSSYYSLPDKNTISSKSFRNLFCSPTPESLGYWQDTFKDFNGSIKGIWEKYHDS